MTIYLLNGYPAGLPGPGSLRTSVQYRTTLLPGYYNGVSFANLLETALRSVIPMSSGLTCVYYQGINSINITTNSVSAIFFPTDYMLNTEVKWQGYKQYASKSCNDLLGNNEAPITASSNHFKQPQPYELQKHFHFFYNVGMFQCHWTKRGVKHRQKSPSECRLWLHNNRCFHLWQRLYILRQADAELVGIHHARRERQFLTSPRGTRFLFHCL